MDDVNNNINETVSSSDPRDFWKKFSFQFMMTTHSVYSISKMTFENKQKKKKEETFPMFDPDRVHLT